MSDTHENPTPASNSPPANVFVAFFHVLTGAATWVVNLPAATWDRLWNGVTRVWGWVTGLLNAPDKGFEIRTGAEANLLIHKAQAREIELKAEADAEVRKAEAEKHRADAQYRFAESMLVEAQAEMEWAKVERARAEIALMSQNLAVRQQVVDAGLAASRGAVTTVAVKDDLVDVTIEHGNAVAKAGKGEADAGCARRATSQSITNGKNGHEHDSSSPQPPEA